MSPPDASSAGRAEAGRVFDSTRWSLVLRAKDRSGSALEALCRLYRHALLIWLKRRGLVIPGHDVEDLVQGFFLRLFQRDFLANVTQEKGRFRTFLLTAFDRHLKDLWRKETADKRGGGTPPVPLHQTDQEGRPIQDPASPSLTPEEAYDRACAEAVLKAAWQRLEEACAASGHAALLAALEPVWFGTDDGLAYTEIAQNLDMTPGNVRVAAHRLRKALRELIREEVRQTVANPEDLAAELAYLRGLYSRSNWEM